MLKTFKFKQIIFRVLTREKKELKASTATGIRHQLWKIDTTALQVTIGKKITQVMGSVQLPSLYSILQGNPRAEGA